MPNIRYEQPAWLSRWEDKCGHLDTLDLGLLPDKQAERMRTIIKANGILDEYEAKGFQLTLRQLYYQFVARDLIPNNDREYKKLGSVVSDGRMWGFIDWDRLVDRGRNFEQRGHWDDAADIVRACANSFNLDRWTGSGHRIEVWVEKQALEDIVAQACRPLDVGYIACKGYMSQSEMWAAAQRLISHEQRGQETLILHLGDHDPSGIDMSRDIQDRLRTFHCCAYVDRIALNMDQIRQYDPPPNPTKLTDSRAQDYIEQFGYESWELDALEPEVITALIQDEIKERIDSNYRDREAEEKKTREELTLAADNWGELEDMLQNIAYRDEDS